VPALWPKEAAIGALRASRLVQGNRSIMIYQSRADPQAVALRQRLTELAAIRGRYGSGSVMARTAHGSAALKWLAGQKRIMPIRVHPIHQNVILSKGQQMYFKIGKRLLDLAITIPVLLLFSPVLAALALLVRLKLGSPMLFRQQRPGLYGRPFTIYKFRSMTTAYDAAGKLLPDEERSTAFGKVLRHASLDELPELINVLKGDISLVGPRPLLMEYLDRYTPEQKRRHEVLPGITGLAQVSGRNYLSWEEKFALDVWYVDHCSAWLDFKILAMTIRVVLGGEGVSAPSHVSAPEFLGTTRGDTGCAGGEGRGLPSAGDFSSRDAHR
jgi:sugar transferase EpsL